MKIPFNKVSIIGKETNNIIDAVSNGWIGGDGEFTNKVQRLLESSIECKKSLLTTSCTHALEMAAILIDLKDDEEVIVPSYTFTSSALAFMMNGAKIVFSDIRQDTLNIDEAKLENLINNKTKAIVVVHYAGVACNMDEINRIGKKYNLVIVEDNAHGLYGKYKGKFLGTIGDLATQSFHETKNFTCGEGGALLINNNKFFDRAEIIREKGTDRSKFFRGEIDKYSWVDKGSSYVMSDILAAFLYGQLELSSFIQSSRKETFEKYYFELSDWALLNGVRLPYCPEECESAFHMFYLIMPSHSQQLKMISYLKSNGISSTFHYIPLHTSKVGRELGYIDSDLPVSLEVSLKIVRLPLFNTISSDEIGFIIDKIKKYNG
jgi:dTDP-4-amino-4,6-dideoxygalactose transaminase